MVVDDFEDISHLKASENASVKDREDKVYIYGKSSKTGSHERIEIERKIIGQVVREALEPIVELCKKVIISSGPSFSRTIQEAGLIVSGGTANLENFDIFLAKRLNINYVSIANNPEKCVIRGAEIYEMYKYDLYNKGFIRPSR